MSSEVTIREARSSDSQVLAEFFDTVGKESNFLTLNEVGILLTENQISEYL